jgi:hypothetical protein
MGAGCSFGDVTVQMAPGTGGAAGQSGNAGGSDAMAGVGCDELGRGVSAVANLDIDAKAKVFVQAAADLQNVTATMTAAVKTACGNIAQSLGATDTWSSLGGSDGVTAACNAAAAAINRVLNANADAKISVIVSGGQCSVNADVQASCEGSCKADVNCQEPMIDVRCRGPNLSGQCSGTCNANATCEGSATVAANCWGTCSARCTGTCSGACEGTVTGGCAGTCDGKCDGVTAPAGGSATCTGTCEGKCSALPATATCAGKCAASCKGTCTGNCTLDATANVNCGASVSCKGGCSVAYTAPKCEAALDPPSCNGDASCQASCGARALLDAQCASPTVDVLVTGNAMSVAALKATLEANLPTLWLFSRTDGPLAVTGAGKLAATGSAAVSAAAGKGSKTVACVGVAASTVASASAGVSVSVGASASVLASAGAS